MQKNAKATSGPITLPTQWRKRTSAIRSRTGTLILLTAAWVMVLPLNRSAAVPPPAPAASTPGGTSPGTAGGVRLPEPLVAAQRTAEESIKKMFPDEFAQST